MPQMLHQACKQLGWSHTLFSIVNGAVLLLLWSVQAFLLHSFCGLYWDPCVVHSLDALAPPLLFAVSRPDVFWLVYLPLGPGMETVDVTQDSVQNRPLSPHPLPHPGALVGGVLKIGIVFRIL